MSKFSVLKNRLLCAAVLISTFLFVIFYGGKVPYALLYTSVGLICVSVTYLIITLLLCDVICVLDKRDVVKGDDVIITIEIKNNSPLFIPYINISFKETVEFDSVIQDESLSVAAYSGKRARISLTSKYRGKYDVNIPEIRLMDFLGILNIAVKYPRLPDVLVYPHVCELDEFSAVGKFEMDNQINPENISEDITAISDVREYMLGDSMRRIHWNLSARMLSFMSKNYENITKSRLTLLLNLSQASELPYEKRLRLEDRTIETAVSIVFHFLNKLWNVTLNYYENEYYTYRLSGANMFGMAYNHLAFVSFTAAYDISKIVENVYMDTIGEHLNLCVVTQDVSEDLLDRVIKYAELGSRIALLYVCETKAGLERAQWVKAIGKSPVSLFVIDAGSDLRDALVS